MGFKIQRGERADFGDGSGTGPYLSMIDQDGVVATFVYADGADRDEAARLFEQATAKAKSIVAPKR